MSSTARFHRESNAGAGTAACLERRSALRRALAAAAQAPGHGAWHVPYVAMLLSVLIGGCAGDGAPLSALPGGADPGGSASAETLRAPPPQDWRATTQLNQGDMRLLEYEPPAGSAMANDETLRLESFRRDPLPGVTEFLNDLGADYKRRCATANIQLIRADIENGFPVEVRLLTCPGSDPTRPPLQMFKAIRGDAWFYVVSRSSRTAIATREHVDELAPRIAAWAVYMREVTLCVPDSAPHPCASTRPSPRD